MPIPWAIRTSQVDVHAGRVESRGRAARCIEATPKPRGVPKIPGGPLQCHRCTRTTQLNERQRRQELGEHEPYQPPPSSRDRDHEVEHLREVIP